MISKYQTDYTHHILDRLLDTLWEDETFLDTFCSGCPALAHVVNGYADECPTCFDPHSPWCERSGLKGLVEFTLKDAAEDIVLNMDGWGCLDCGR